MAILATLPPHCQSGNDFAMRSGGRLMSLLRALAERLLYQEVDRRRLIRRCALAALLLVVGVYADVIFCGASISVANIQNVTAEPAPNRVRLFPERPGRQPHHGYYDSAGAGFQSEPAAQFMTRSIWGGQSIFWNPYSGTGALGPETLVDVKTSPLSVAVAVLGGSDLAFHLVFLGLNFVGVFCLLVLFAVELRLSLLAAIAGGITYLLNGFNVANLASNVSQTWLYFPILILALVTFAKRPSALSFVGITAGAVLILATTFLPTTLVILGGSLFVGLAAALAAARATRPDWIGAAPAAARNAAGQLSAAGLALLVLAALYLPIAEALRYMSTGDYYAARQFNPAHLFNLITLFTPKHAFEAYNAITQRAAELRGNVAFHQGIVGALIASQAVRVWPPFQRVVLVAIGAAFLLLAARVYGVPGYTRIVDVLPVIGNIGQQYVWAGVSMFFTLLVPFGMHGLLRGGPRKAALACGCAVIAFALVYTSAIYRLDVTGFIYVAFAGFLLGAGGLLILAVPRQTLQRAAATSMAGMCLVLLSWVELTSYVNHDRLTRTERFSNPPEFVRFLQTQAGLHRVASYGLPGIPPEYGSAYGIAQIGSMNFQIFPRYEALFNRLILPDPADRWSGFVTMVSARDGDRLNLAAIDLVGAKLLVVPKRYLALQKHAQSSGWHRVYDDAYVTIYENPDPLPRTFVVHRLVESPRTPLDEKLSPRVAATSDDARLIEAARTLGVGEEASGGGADTAAISGYDHTRVEIRADLKTPGVLVLTDAWHPNWSVRIDGRPAELGRVNESFRGVALPAGQHVIEMRYAPRTLALGQALSVLGLVLVGAIIILHRRVDSTARRVFSAAACQRNGADPRL
jgi:Bacterial membrane protein YfhO